MAKPPRANEPEPTVLTAAMVKRAVADLKASCVHCEVCALWFSRRTYATAHYVDPETGTHYLRIESYA